MPIEQALELVTDHTGRNFVSQTGEDWTELWEKTFQPPFLVGEYATSNLRGLLRWGVLSDGINLPFDVALLYEGQTNLVRLARENLKTGLSGELLSLESRLKAHLRAAKEAKVSRSLTMFDYVPQDLLREVFWVRGKAILALVDEALRDPSRASRYAKIVRPFALALYRMERAGIKVDLPKLDAFLKLRDLPDHERNFLRSMKGLVSEDGFLQTRVSPVGGKTGRCRVEGGFHCMGIPHGICRELLVSRWEGGEVWSLDFNAIDYRCIMRAVGGKLGELYEDAKDFHARTMELALGSYDPVQRETFKKVTYVYLYGGSDRTLTQATGLTEQKLRDLLTKLDFLKPVAELRDNLLRYARQDGYIDIPQGGGRVVVEKEDHAGKVLGLFAQGFASFVFSKAVTRAVSVLRNFRSVAVFPVHDELVIDAHPEELRLKEKLVEEMQQAAGAGFVVNLKEGKNYAEAT